ncbi:hypothetical protein OIU34_04560 [Pararhizobium sp. BT-229]|uniref:hypothetical protein n=1 Tax=Pararhizobium sp. BT-229 TaxID=2986923 RepID=UPI0021F7556D|nr:hypothetical protein [Pararhizobium sp. BT-229]MCV9961165.1 hypothetical protein [Pararhizobium sp. BT-229]
MTIEPAKFRVSHPDPSLSSQEAIERALREILADVHARGWSINTINAMEKVLRNLRLTYADSDPSNDPDDMAPGTYGDPDPTNDWPAAMSR